ncbi:MAG: T9SS type A sorting domain-containing protein [Chlorobi bacterium]|nr:T9SS type A sorting domain-containing protein [Chlorobiota bacterium]
MKTISIIILMLISLCIKSQVYAPYWFECTMPEDPPEAVPDLIGGLYKPESIDNYTSEQGAYFPVIIVYVQFDEDPGAEVDHWPQGEEPDYMGDVLATAKSTNYGSNWWNAYNENTATLSDYWMEVSRGELHLVGREVNIVLPHDVDWYESNGTTQQCMEDLFTALASEISNDWPLFDLWAKVDGEFVYGSGDGYVDMLYIVARSNPETENVPDGYFRPYGVFFSCPHYEHTVYTSGLQTIKLQPSFSETGSGFQISRGYFPMLKWETISFSEHEHAHYFFGYGAYWEYHQTYSKVNNYYGMEEYLSPYEIIRLGYQTPQEVGFDLSAYPIDDWTSRGSGSEMLKVPIGSSSRNEFFLIANRQRISAYDGIMWGDTMRGNPYFDLGNQSHYPKGIYIYHAYPGEVAEEGYPWGIHWDQECADGLWDWEHNGYAAPDWDINNPWLPVYNKVEPVFDLNDNSGEGYGNFNSLYNRDGKNVSKFFSPNFNHVKWFSVGQKEAQQNGTGTDRIYTNTVENWTSREWQGDRWDAWRVGYNEVFSPYSSPSTVDWDDDPTGIFIYLESMDGETANLQIYKVGENNMDEDDILAETPPSRPMLYRAIEIYNCNGTYGHPRIIWDNNTEPDMVRDGDYKSYKIYRAHSTNSGIAPWSYSYLATYDDYTPDDTANFIDNHLLQGVRIYCGTSIPPAGYDVYYRYYIVAVDKYDDESVPSDFLSIKGRSNNEDNPVFNNPDVPKAFRLNQNYPNPFNPSTEIKYDLPYGRFVTLKIFNVLGAEVATLVNNEYKPAGYYSVTFDGSNFASGIYFYTIEAGNFKDSKKMVLIK